MDNNLQQVVAGFKAYLKQEKKKGRQAVPKSASQETTPKSSTRAAATGRAEAVGQLCQQFADCQNCLLGRTRKKLVFGEGDPDARLMFIGEGPGFDEDQTGRPFIGKAGQLLTKAIETTINLRREEVYIGNIVKCHPMKNPDTPEMRGNDRPPSTEEMAACLPIITRQIEIINPEIICLLGRTATQAILKSNEGLHQLRNQFHTLNFGGKDLQFIATVHPASCLYDPSNKKYIWEDFKKIRDFLKKTS
ncbi:MAG: uracil-DNA glycosylase [Elusimicrobia bacterium]|nr:uracil-DNA glycosylase [Elusimicrobiota bacterium]